MTVKEVAAFLRAHDSYLILTHRRPDGDTLGCAAALCAMLRQMGKTAALLPNAEVTSLYADYVAPYWAAEDYRYETVVSVDLAALGLFPDNAERFKNRADLAIDHHHPCRRPAALRRGQYGHRLLRLLQRDGEHAPRGCRADGDGY